MYKTDFFTTNSAELRSGHVIVPRTSILRSAFHSLRPTVNWVIRLSRRLATLGRPEHIRNGRHLDGQPSLVTNCGRITGNLEVSRSRVEVGSEVAHRAAPRLATVRRSNCTCGFPACSFHEGSPFRDAIKVLTVLVNEWTFFASVGSIQSDSILGRKCTGISLMELIHLSVLTHCLAFLFPTAFAGCLPRPTSVAGRPVT